MLAPNVMTVGVDHQVVAEFADPGIAKRTGFATVRPNRGKWNSDIAWVSATTLDSHSIFRSAFDRLGLAEHARPYLDLDSAVQLYAGFLVIRSACDASYFHVDWAKTNNEAFTAMTPVSDNMAGFGLLYENLLGEVGNYEYQRGEAILFGDRFSHSTKPGRSDEPVVLLCFEFGTDKMEHWDKIYRTIGTQALMLCRPDGQFTAGKTPLQAY